MHRDLQKRGKENFIKRYARLKFLHGYGKERVVDRTPNLNPSLRNVRIKLII